MYQTIQLTKHGEGKNAFFFYFLLLTIYRIIGDSAVRINDMQYGYCIRAYLE